MEASGLCAGAKSVGCYWYSISSVTPKLLCIQKLCSKLRVSSLWPVKLTTRPAVLFRKHRGVLYYLWDKITACAALGAFYWNVRNGTLPVQHKLWLWIWSKLISDALIAFCMFRGQQNGRNLTAGAGDKLWPLRCLWHPTRNSQDTDEPLTEGFQQRIYNVLPPISQLHVQLCLRDILYSGVFYSFI